MKARLLSGTSALALWAAMPSRDLEREKALTEAAHKVAEAVRLARRSLKEQADG